MIGAGGIYIAFLWYGSLQEDVFSFQTADGTKFTFVWFLQCMEACTNIVVGLVGRHFCGGVPNLPLRQFALTGLSQVLSKALTALSLASGLSFPVATLAKSGKMAPVMLGQLILGGATYSLREYSQVAAIIGGTAMLSLGKKVRKCYYFFCLFLIVNYSVHTHSPERISPNEGWRINAAWCTFYHTFPRYGWNYWGCAKEVKGRHGSHWFGTQTI
jgi:hypothetical protein